MRKHVLEPIDTIATALFWLFVAGTIGGTVQSLVTRGELGLFPVGSSICVEDRGISAEGPDIGLAEPGVRTTFTGLEFCDTTPSADQVLWSVLGEAISLAFTFGALFLLWRLIRTAAKQGAYAAPVVGWIWWLGWWLLAGGVLAPLAQSMTDFALMTSMERAASWVWPDISLMVVLTGLGLITFARIMRVGVRMQEELQGTV